MNIWEYEIMNAIKESGYENQRQLASVCGCSLGVVNRSLRALTEEGYLDGGSMRLSEKAEALFRSSRPKNAVILAAGFGMRMIPINTETPKGLLEINGEALIERLIKQLLAVAIRDITVVVGFMKERYEYLIDDYGVKLAVNPEYAVKNNLHSLLLTADRLSDTYIIPCDVWCQNNPFRRHELYSWYMVSDAEDETSPVRVNRKQELVTVPESAAGCRMLGIAYLQEAQAAQVRDRLRRWSRDARYDGAFWEAALYDGDRVIVRPRVVPEGEAVEINTFEQLRDMDGRSRNLRSDAIDTIAKALGAGREEITDIEMLKKGMTNRSFLFSCRGEKYIMRIPGEGTDQLIDRAKEAAAYEAVRGRGLCDDVVYINPANGYKITRYLENTRVCDPLSEKDVTACMDKLRSFHAMELTVEHTFDIFGQIEFYETLRNGAPDLYRDYRKTKANVMSLRPFIERTAGKKVLTHIDAVPDNFLFSPDGAGGERIHLIDWEYAGMQDPHVDIAMFCIYALYDREQVDRLIDLYFTEGCPEETRLKIYCYIAACGLLWSNWCEYKLSLGVDFGEYSLRQYRYAKDYYRIVHQALEESES